MKNQFVIVCILCLLSLNLCFAQEQAKAEMTPEQLAQAQLDAYNARDIDAFLIPYSDSVELYNFPNEQWGKGKKQMQEVYGSMFEKTPLLHCELKSRMVLGSTVIDEERVTGFGEGNVIEAIAIYKIKDGKIFQVYFIRKDQ